MSGSSGHPQTLIEAGFRWQSEGQVDRAETAYWRALELVPEHPTALQLLGSLARRRGDLAEAERMMRRSLAVMPAQPHVLNNLGNVLLAAGQLEAAVATFDQAITLAPSMHEAHFNRARCLLQQGRLDPAHDGLRRTLEMLPAPTAAALHLQARIEMERGQLVAAQQSFERALDIATPTPALLHDFATLCQRRHRPDEALRLHEQAQALGLNDADAHYNHGNTLQSLGRLDDALHAYRRALARQPAHRLALMDGARLRWRLGHKDFDTDLLAAEAVDATASVARPLRAALLLRAERHDEAAQAYRVALAAAPNDAALHDGLARCLMRQGDVDAALAGHARAVAVAVAHGQGHATLRATYAASLLAAGRTGIGAQQAEAALVAAPHDSYALALLGQAWRESGDARERWLNDYASLVAVVDLPAPAGFVDIQGFCAALVDELAALHTDREAPVDQTLRKGTQTLGELFEQGHHLVDALKVGLAVAVQAYIDRLPVDSAHPFLSRRAAAWRFTDSWSSRLRCGGYHTPHVHPHGWISSVCYIAVPPAAGDISRREGWLELGRPEFGAGPHAQARRVVQPQVGRLVLFPSMFWHGTTPFDDAEQRLTIAFDVVPA